LRDVLELCRRIITLSTYIVSCDNGVNATVMGSSGALGPAMFASFMKE
jgi:hypothetical protein